MLMLSNLKTPSFLIAIAGLAGLAHAAPPSVLDHVPADAVAVVTISNVGELMQDISRINGALGDKGNPMLPMMMGMIGGMPGMDMSGSIAIVVSQIDPENMDPSALSFILPVTDLELLIQSMGGQANDGVSTINMQGQKMSLRSLGDGFAVVNQSPEACAAFDGGAGKMDANMTRLGANGAEAVSGSDLSVMINIAAMAPLLQPLLDEKMEEARAMMAMMPEAEQAEMSIDLANHAAHQFLTDASMCVLSISADDLGVGFNFATQFNAESELAGFFDAAGDSHGLLDRVPGGAYFFAAAADFGWPGFTVAMEAFDAMMEQMKEAQPEALEMMGDFDFMGIMENATGYAQVVSVNPGGMQAGLFKNSTTYLAGKNPAGLMEFQKSATMMADGMGAEGFAMTATYEEGAATINGTELDSYSSTFTVDENAMMGGMGPGMIMQMLFGPDMGPKGYLGLFEGGIFQTTTQDEAYVSSAIDAAKNGGGLGSDEGIAAISGRLPTGRFVELYIGTDHLLNNIMPMAAMFGAVEAFEPVENMSPIALGISGHAGGFNFGAFIPLEVIEIAAELAPATTTTGSQNVDEDPEF